MVTLIQGCMKSIPMAPLPVLSEFTATWRQWTEDGRQSKKRVDVSLSFDRTWTEYKNGFGRAEQDVWVGNDVIHQLTKENNSFLYMSITLQNGTSLFEKYDRFSVSREISTFLAGPATGTLGDSMLNTGNANFDLSGIYFSTPDRDHDRWGGGGSCAAGNWGGWWFNLFRLFSFNGPWYPESWTYPWYPKITSGDSVRETMMLVKRH